MTYSGFDFLGRPLPGTLRIASRADLSYRASFVIGLIPALNKRTLAVSYGIPSNAAISVIVKPSIIFISEIVQKKTQKKQLKKFIFI